MLKNALKLNFCSNIQLNNIIGQKWKNSSLFWILEGNIRYIPALVGGGYQQIRQKKDDSSYNSTLFKPVPITSNPDDINIGLELTGKLDKGELLKILNRFTQKRETKLLCTENGLDGNLNYIIKYSIRNNKIIHLS